MAFWFEFGSIKDGAPDRPETIQISAIWDIFGLLRSVARGMAQKFSATISLPVAPTKTR